MPIQIIKLKLTLDKLHQSEFYNDSPKDTRVISIIIFCLLWFGFCLFFRLFHFFMESSRYFVFQKYHCDCTTYSKAFFLPQDGFSQRQRPLYGSFCKKKAPLGEPCACRALHALFMPLQFASHSCSTGCNVWLLLTSVQPLVLGNLRAKLAITHS